MLFSLKTKHYISLFKNLTQLRKPILFERLKNCFFLPKALDQVLNDNNLGTCSLPKTILKVSIASINPQPLPKAKKTNAQLFNCGNKSELFFMFCF